MSRIRILLLYTTFLTAVLACQKEPVLVENRLDLLTGRDWQLTKLLYSVDNSTPGDIANVVFKDCEKDDRYRFRKDFVFQRVDSTISCGGLSVYGPYEEASWGTDSLVTTLVIDKFFFYHYDFTIKQLSSRTLELEQATTDYLQQKEVYNWIFTAVK